MKSSEKENFFAGPLKKIGDNNYKP